MSPTELIAIVAVTFSVAIVTALKLSRPTIINNYAPKAEASARADGGGSSPGTPGLIMGGLVKLGLLGILLAVALAVIGAITGVSTTATNAISEAARPVIVQEYPALPPVEVQAPVSAPVPVSVPAVAISPVVFSDFISAGGWIPAAIIIALILTRTRGRSAPVIYPRQAAVSPQQSHQPIEQGIPMEDVPLFSSRENERSRK